MIAKERELAVRSGDPERVRRADEWARIVTEALWSDGYEPGLDPRLDPEFGGPEVAR
jgi:hypothetical protein